MKIKLLVSEANGKYLYEPKTVAELEHILGAPVVLFKKAYLRIRAWLCD